MKPIDVRALANTNGYPIAGLLIPVILFAAGCFFWFKVRPNCNRRDERWLKVFDSLFLVEKVINYIAFFYLTEESLWEGIYEGFGLICVLTSGYIS